MIGEKLIGIKAIAKYFDISVRNIYHWEKNLGLPLHRVSKNSGYRIYALKDELDEWLKKRDDKTIIKSNNIKLYSLIILCMITLVGVIYIWFSSQAGKMDPQVIQVDKNIINIKNSNGQVLWSIIPSNQVSQRELNLLLDIRDIDSDGMKEIVSCTYEIPSDRYSITLFDNDGTVIWSKYISAGTTFNNIEIDNHYRPGPVKFAKSGKNEILVVSKWNHMERFLSIVATHDLKGNLISRYLHVGNLTSTLELFDVDNDGIEEILFTGTNNLLNGEGIVGVLPIDNFYGISPPSQIEPEYNHLAGSLKNYIADEIIPGNQLVYIRFKRTEYLSEYMTIYNNSEIAYISDKVIHVRLFPWYESDIGKYFGFDFVFDNEFNLKQILDQPMTRKIFPELLLQRYINISLRELKEIYGQNVFRWDKDHWNKVKIEDPR